MFASRTLRVGSVDEAVGVVVEAVVAGGQRDEHGEQVVRVAGARQRHDGAIRVEPSMRERDGVAALHDRAASAVDSEPREVGLRRGTRGPPRPRESESTAAGSTLRTRLLTPRWGLCRGERAPLAPRRERS